MKNMRVDKVQLEVDLKQALYNMDNVEREVAQIWWAGRVEELKAELEEFDNFLTYLKAWHKKVHIDELKIAQSNL